MVRPSSRASRLNGRDAAAPCSGLFPGAMMGCGSGGLGVHARVGWGCFLCARAWSRAVRVCARSCARSRSLACSSQEVCSRDRVRGAG
eukprot:3728233-Prymnesium_polylepis.2